MKRGFTIVELLIVVVVIAILAGITIVNYNGIVNRAAEAAVKTDLRSGGAALQIHQIENNTYPNSLSELNSGQGLTFTSGDASYSRTGSGFCLSLTSSRNAAFVFHTTEEGSITSGDCPAVATDPACFTFSSGAITAYSSAGSCPRAVVIPGTISGTAVTTIGPSAFESQSLTSVTFPNSITLIGHGAFDSNLLTTVTFPNSLTSIGAWSFSGNQLTEVTVPTSVTFVGHALFQDNNDIACNFPTGLDYNNAGCDTINYY